MKTFEVTIIQAIGVGTKKEIVKAFCFELVGPRTAVFKDGQGINITMLSEVESIRLLNDVNVFEITNTRGEMAQAPIQHIDAVGGEGCKATTSEIKP